MLKTGAAYHGNRMMKHVRDDMIDMIHHNMNLVVHMYTHNDMLRHSSVMKDIIALSEDLGLEVWVDNWGIDGGPGDKANFVAQSPEDRMFYSDGNQVINKPCYNSENFFAFTKTWIEYVKEADGKTIFWDEPHIPGSSDVYACYCPKCKKLFEEQYNKPMPTILTPEVAEFRTWTIVNYFEKATRYAREMGIINTVCVMFGKHDGVSIDNLDRLCAIETLENVGCDPYWTGHKFTGTQVYDYVYDRTRLNLDQCERFNKDHNIWIQVFGMPGGREEDIIYATDAAYDAGARTIIAWSYRAGESNNYRATNCDLAWFMTGEAMRRIRDRNRDEIRGLARKNLNIL